MKDFLKKIMWSVWRKWVELKIFVLESIDDEVDLMYPTDTHVREKNLTIQAVQQSRDFTSILVEVTTPNGFVYPGVVRKDFTLPTTFAFHKGRPRPGELVIGVKRSTNGPADVVVGGSSLQEEFLAEVTPTTSILWIPLDVSEGSK